MTTIFWAGDSTVKRNGIATYPQTGIGQEFDRYVRHYGVQIDEARYTVCYSAFAENLMPDITVLENVP